MQQRVAIARAVDLPEERDQLTTRSDPRFIQLRTHLYAQIQQAERGGDQPTPPASPEGRRRRRAASLRA